MMSIVYTKSDSIQRSRSKEREVVNARERKKGAKARGTNEALTHCRSRDKYK